jgi:hypothetical protein
MSEFYDHFYQKYNNQLICPNTGKKSFSTKTQIKKHRREYELKYKKYFRIYLCEHCGNWHLTTAETKYDRHTH